MYKCKNKFKKGKKFGFKYNSPGEVDEDVSCPVVDDFTYRVAHNLATRDVKV